MQGMYAGPFPGPRIASCIRFHGYDSNTLEVSVQAALQAVVFGCFLCKMQNQREDAVKKALLELTDQLADSVTLTGGVTLADPVETGSKLAFETTDLEGNPVTSEEIFSGHKITMINMWATWCDPCKNELPELAEMAKDFEKKGCQIIGLCLDAEDEETMAEGRAILNNAGVDYLNITPFEGREELLPNTMFPTSYFVDENGIVLDEVVNGALLEKYPKALEKLLAGLAPEASGS